jgi:hypothetical protein
VVAELDLIVSGGTGAMTGGVIRPLLAPFDAVSDVWRDAIVRRLTTTGGRVARKRGQRTLEVTERTAVNALAAAALTDDAVVQEYLAGVVASASVENDNAHMLALIGRLTPIQMRLHYGLYLGAAMHIRREIAALEDAHERWEEANDYDDTREMVTLITDPGLPRGNEWDRVERALDNLRREGLVNSRATYWDSTEQGIVSFKVTPFGVDLFAAALGVEIIAFGDLCECELDVLQLDPVIPSMETESMERFSDVYGNTDQYNAWRHMIEARDDVGGV